MRRFFILFTFLVFSNLADAQSFQKPQYEVGLGYALRPQMGFGIPRLTIAANDFFDGNGKGLIGAYATLEYRNGINFIEDGTNYYFRMPTGLSFALPKMPKLHFFGGVDIISFSLGKNLRKEIGLRYAIDNKYSFRAGYSNTVGVTIGAGMLFPVNRPRS